MTTKVGSEFSSVFRPINNTRELLRRAVTQYLGFPPDRPFRRQFEAVLREVLLCSHYGHLLAKKSFGEDAVEESRPAIECQVSERARAVFDGIDRGEEE